MCEFCENVDEMHIIEEGHFKGSYLPSNNKNQIVKDKNSFHIWSDGEGDPFQCGVCVENILFCPKCGRKLSEGEETENEV